MTGSHALAGSVRSTKWVRAALHHLTHALPHVTDIHGLEAFLCREAFFAEGIDDFVVRRANLVLLAEAQKIAVDRLELGVAAAALNYVLRHAAHHHLANVGLERAPRHEGGERGR